MLLFYRMIRHEPRYRQQIHSSKTLPAKLKKTTVQAKPRIDKLKINKQKQDIRVIGFYSFDLIIN